MAHAPARAELRLVSTLPRASSRIPQAGLTGVVHGQTTPSVTSIHALGAMEEDCAVHVFFPVRNKGFRLAPELIEFVGHGATAIRLKGSSREWLKSAAGGWTEVDRATRHGGKP